MLSKLRTQIGKVQDYKVIGTITEVKGLLVTCAGITDFVNVGSQCLFYDRNHKKIMAEVTAVENDKALVMPFDHLSDVGVGCKVELIAKSNVIYPDNSWLGRVLDAKARPLDKGGELITGEKKYSLQSQALPAYNRKLGYEKLDLGIRSLNIFSPCCYGQRMGIFAGSGVGKSILLSMISTFSTADVKIIGLIGERGREVQQFLQEYIGSEGLKNTILIVATSDEMALMRKRAALLTITISEYFRDQGLEVLCLIDSITRFAMAQREIGLSVGEMQTTKGYTPTVFSEMSRLLERAGPGELKQGNITGLFTVLVEGDDTNEPISDSVRSILDGHIILDRDIAERGRFPAVNVLKSVSRSLPKCNDQKENELMMKARKLLSTYSEMEDMIKLGAYKQGVDREIDKAIYYYPLLEKFLEQKIDQPTSIKDSNNELEKILEGKN